MSSQGELPFHVCLAGEEVSADWALIRALRLRHVVTLVAQLDFIQQSELLRHVTLLVLDGTGVGSAVLEQLQAILARCPGLNVVLVDGGLSQREVAEAFRLGARDYFAEPYEVDLLVERIDALCCGPPSRTPVGDASSGEARY